MGASRRLNYWNFFIYGFFDTSRTNTYYTICFVKEPEMSIEVVGWGFEEVEQIFSITKKGWICKVSTQTSKSITKWKVVCEWKWIEYLKWRNLVIIQYEQFKPIACDSVPCADDRSIIYQRWEMQCRMWSCVFSKDEGSLFWCNFLFSNCC